MDTDSASAVLAQPQDQLQSVAPSQDQLQPETVSDQGAGSLDQMQPGTVSQGQSPNIPQTTPASQDPEMQAGAVHQSWLAKLMHGAASLLGGDETWHVSRDQNGNISATSTPSTDKEKWSRIASAVLGGAAKGFSVGTGPGGAARAVGAGFEQGAQAKNAQKQQVEQDVATQQQQMMRNANNAKLNLDVTRLSFDNSHMTRDDLQKQKDYALKHAEEMQTYGVKPIMTGVKDPKTLAQYGINNKDAVDAHLGKDGGMIFNEPDGNGGVNIYQMTGDQANTPTTEADKTEVISVDPKDPTKTVSTWLNTPAGEKVGARATRRMGQIVQNDNAIRQAQQAKVAQQEADTKSQEQKDRASLLPSEEKKNLASATESYAKAAESQANAAFAKNATNYVPGKDPVLDDTAEGLASGRYLEGQIPKRTGKGQYTPQEQYAAANVMSQRMYGLPYNPTIIDQENNFAKQPKTQAYLEGIDRMTGAHGDPGQLNQLLTLAKQTGLGPNAPLNLVEQTIKQKWGDKAANNFHTLLLDTQSNLGTLVGNPLLGSGESDKKLKLAQDAFGANATLDNMTGQVQTVTDVLTRSRNSMAANNRYIQQRYGTRLSPQGAQNNNQPSTFTRAVTQPPNPPYAGAVYGTGAKGTGWYPPAEAGGK